MEIQYDLLIVQFINFLILFLLFKYTLGDPIAREIDKRKKLTEKIERANEEYEEIIVKANVKSEEIIDKAKQHKSTLMEEARILAERQKDQYVMEAERKANEIITNANKESFKLQKELEDNFEEGVKSTAKSVLKKIFNEDTQLQEKYVQNAVKEFKGKSKS